MITDAVLTYENFRKQVLNYGQEKALDCIQRNFVPSLKDGRVNDKIGVKKFQVICSKGFIDDYDPIMRLRPYGWQGRNPATMNTPSYMDALLGVD